MSELITFAVAHGYSLRGVVWCAVAKEAEKMRSTLEDLYYGNITPGAQQIVPNSELKRATDRVARFESQLTERLDEDGQTSSLSRGTRSKASRRGKTSSSASDWEPGSQWSAWTGTTAMFGR